MNVEQIDLERAESLLEKCIAGLEKRIDFEIDELLDEDGDPEIFLHDGDLKIDGNFSVEHPCLIINGDLTVENLFSDCGGLDFSLTVVLGKVRAKNLMTFGEMHIAKDAVVEGLIWANSLNDWSFNIYGGVKATAVVETGTLTILSGPLDTVFLASLANEMRIGEKNILERYHILPSCIFLDEFVDNKDYPLQDEIKAALEKGQGVLKALVRPDSVPAECYWSAKDGEWVMEQFDDPDNRSGFISYWRPDGTLCCKEPYQNGILHGEFIRYHQNGEISVRGSFDNGQLVGTRQSFRSKEYTTERWADGLPDSIVKIENDLKDGKIVAVRLFNVQGDKVDRYGKPV